MILVVSATVVVMLIMMVMLVVLATVVVMLIMMLMVVVSATLVVMLIMLVMVTEWRFFVGRSVNGDDYCYGTSTRWWW